MDTFRKVFPFFRSNIIGMVHVKALPGTPCSSLSIHQITDIALKEALIYSRLGVDSILIENMHDIPYLKKVGPEIVSAMTAVATTIRKEVPSSLPIGVQILAGANKEALSVAHAANLQYIRAEGYVFGHIGDEGYIDACAGEILRFRKSIGASDVAVLCDIKKKHSSHSITSDISLIETIKAATFFDTEGVILTGKETGDEVSAELFKEVESQKLDVPILIGSGVTKENVHQFMSAHGLIVGSYFKKQGKWKEDLDVKRIADFMSRVDNLRNEATHG
ncbi:uncharacterized protein F13E9.13, mitochondrial [Lepeophtheirus salmonis]|uniref:uncharacterized protein F13E9.13, mitochondrial n=1 Tax=Lepeophtheirus salmonis TaxID=72036 RepID=UPI001AE62736|nr:uncharacterized protein F13E9.13, mitochondrial-like [Lepeophtheirus salmonis]XP_040575852.1 uncharacterized protein F13E9.13, mitochondrial-like [Lepeophtheirus salmonis]